jgi:hypothetical protein
MSKQTSYSISVEERDIVVRFNRSCIDLDALSRFLDYVELEAIAKRSKLTEEQAASTCRRDRSGCLEGDKAEIFGKVEEKRSPPFKMIPTAETGFLRKTRFLKSLRKAIAPHPSPNSCNQEAIALAKSPTSGAICLKGGSRGVSVIQAGDVADFGELLF